MRERAVWAGVVTTENREAKLEARLRKLEHEVKDLQRAVAALVLERKEKP